MIVLFVLVLHNKPMMFSCESLCEEHVTDFVRCFHKNESVAHIMFGLLSSLHVQL
jgi:hypothetical protein